MHRQQVFQTVRNESQKWQRLNPLAMQCARAVSPFYLGTLYYLLAMWALRCLARELDLWEEDPSSASDVRKLPQLGDGTVRSFLYNLKRIRRLQKHAIVAEREIFLPIPLIVLQLTTRVNPGQGFQPLQQPVPLVLRITGFLPQRVLRSANTTAPRGARVRHRYTRYCALLVMFSEVYHVGYKAPEGGGQAHVVCARQLKSPAVSKRSREPSVTRSHPTGTVRAS